MRNESHTKSLIGIIRDHVIAWRKAEGWSRETVIAVIVERNEQMDSGIVFNPETRDAFERMKVNADRVFRWLDDDSKENNLLPANFIPSILAAMPMERRLACASEIMVSIGLGACMLDDSDEGDPDINDVVETQMASGSALLAAARAIQHPTPENLEAAELQFAKEDQIKGRLRKKLTAARTRAFTKAKEVIGRVFHRKQAA